MMNNNIIKLALDNNLLNYIDNETPRHYFISNNIDVEDVEKFAYDIVQKCVQQIALVGVSNFENEDVSWACDHIVKEIKNYFGEK